MGKTLIIGVGGGTGSGKTTIAKKILQRLAGASVALIPLDAYYRDQSRLPLEQRSATNYDHPNAIDVELLIEHLNALLERRPVQRPVYSYLEHTRTAKTELLEPCEVLIIEGILALADERLGQLMDVRIYVDTDDDIRFIRRLVRDVRERGRSVESVIEQYLGQVRPMHQLYVAPTRRRAHLIVPEGGDNEVAIDIICSKISQSMRRDG
ncbi:MAG: uridine kinase [Candidatus Alcyoniella australis]|nr:uridine kinase [Candidatus Alcyoniella australis]